MKSLNCLRFTLLCSIVFVSCTKNSDQPTTAQYYYPPLNGDQWERGDAAQLGWNTDKLNELTDFVAQNNSTAFIVLHKGRIVVEKYWLGYNMNSSDRIFSASKSMGSFLIGLAQEQGKLDINQPVSRYIGLGWSNATTAQENLITVRHLITMTSGLKEDLAYRDSPGARWFYNTPAYHKIYDVLAAVYGQSNDQYTSNQLWSKIGMQHSSWQAEPGDGLSMACSARDMARFGLMILSDGKWDKTAIVQDQGYFQAMISSSQTINPSYGYLWWLNGKSSYTLPTTQTINGPLMPAAPADLIAALGARDKKIYVVKSRDLVVIRHGAASNYPVQQAVSSFDNELWNRLMAAIN